MIMEGNRGRWRAITACVVAAALLVGSFIDYRGIGNDVTRVSAASEDEINVQTPDAADNEGTEVISPNAAENAPDAAVNESAATVSDASESSTVTDNKTVSPDAAVQTGGTASENEAGTAEKTVSDNNAASENIISDNTVSADTASEDAVWADELSEDEVSLDAAGTASLTLTSGTSLTIDDVLGQDVNYGVLAEEWYMKEAETNCAVALLHSDAQSGDTRTNEPAAGLWQPWIVGQVDGSAVKVKGAAAKVWCLADDAKKFSHEKGAASLVTVPTDSDTLLNSVDTMLKHVKDKSAAMEREGNQITLPTVQNGHFFLDFTRNHSSDLANDTNTYYVNMDPLASKLRETGQVHINKYPGQKIVLNFSGTDITLAKVTVCNDGTASTTEEKGYNLDAGNFNQDADQYEAEKNIFWNMPNATSVTLQTCMGVFIAPNATVEVPGTSSGWVIAKTFKNYAEWHFLNQAMPKTPAGPAGSSSSASAALYLKGSKYVKNISGASTNQARSGYTVELSSDDAFNPADTAVTAADGSFKFTMEYTESGNHTYYIREKKDARDSISYDNTKYQVSVNVVSKNGVLSANVAEMKVIGGSSTDTLSFNNIYKPVATAVFGVKKTVSGDFLAAPYEFTMYALGQDKTAAGSTAADGKAVQTVSTDLTYRQNNSVSFKSLSYDSASANHSYLYLVSENEGKADAVSHNGQKGTTTFDKTYYYVSVNVVPSGDGLKTVIKYSKDGNAWTAYSAGALAFRNIFTLNNYIYGAIDLTGTKTLSHCDAIPAMGPEYKAYLQSLSFNVLSGNSVVAVGSIKDTDLSTGKITFAPDYISFNSTGTYTYTISESSTSASMNFGTNATQTFTVVVSKVGNDFKAKVGETEITALDYKVSNTIKGFTVSKKQITGTEELPGAWMYISTSADESLSPGTDADVKAYWKSGTAPHLVEGLSDNTTYYLHENAAPAGFKKISVFAFKTNAKGNVVKVSENTISTSVNEAGTEITARDDTFHSNFTLDKVDMTGGAGLPGAVLYITRSSASVDNPSADRTVLAYWVSDGRTHTVSGLAAGAAYYLHEYSAPKGYEIINAFRFYVQPDGTVYKYGSESDPVYLKENDKMVVQDARILGSAALSKNYVVNSTRREYITVSGAGFALYYMPLSGNSTQYKKYVSVNMVLPLTDSNGRISVKNLPWGYYYFLETKAPVYLDAKGKAHSYNMRSQQQCYNMTKFTVNSETAASVPIVTCSDTRESTNTNNNGSSSSGSTSSTSSTASSSTSSTSSYTKPYTPSGYTGSSSNPKKPTHVYTQKELRKLIADGQATVDAEGNVWIQGVLAGRLSSDTGDNMNPTMWFLILAGSGLAIMVLMDKMRMRKKK